jgi:hypothetical protein
MDKLLAKYNADRGAGLELECKFDIPTARFNEIYKTILNHKSFGDGVIEMTANAITGEHGSSDMRRYTYKYDGDNLVSDTSYHRKSQVSKFEMKGFVPSKWTLANEKILPNVSLVGSILLRYKLRISFVHSQMPDWRWDFTFGRQNKLDDIKGKVEQVKMSLFKKDINVNNLLDVLNPLSVNFKEFEVEYIGKNKIVDMTNITDIMQLVYSIVNPDHETQVKYQSIIYEIAKHISDHPDKFKDAKHRLKELTNQVLAVPKNVYYSDVYPPIGYYVTPKADGTRSVLLITGSTCVGVTSAGYIEYPLKNTSVKDKLTDENATTIVDVELIDDIAYVFDVMVLEDLNVSKQPFTVRHTHIDEAVKLLNNFIVAKPKQFIIIGNDISASIKEASDIKPEYPIDGLILTAPGSSYHDTKSYKWKPSSHITIDFLAMKCPKSMLGIKPYIKEKDCDLYLLFVGISHYMREKLSLGFIPEYKSLFDSVDSQYYPIQFSPSGNPLAFIWNRPRDGDDLHGKIVELSRELPNSKDSKWIFHRVRTDRSQEKFYYGNDYRIAELTWQMYDDPFTIDDLSVTNAGYFTKSADDIYKASNQFKRFVVSTIMKSNLSNSKWIFDLGSGRGGDLHRYTAIGVEHALFIDRDATAIAELIRRKFTLKSGGDELRPYDINKAFIRKPRGLTIHTMIADLKTPADELLANVYQYGVSPGIIDGFVCNFALHYMCDTVEHITQLLKFISTMAKIGAVFIFTVMDGSSVFNELSNTGKWSRTENGILKYAIERRYNSKTLAKFGQTIAVKLPFAAEMYEEPLCNVDAVISVANGLGFEVEINDIMTSRIDIFKSAAPFVAEQLSSEDIDYIKLHKIVTMRKVN